MKLCKKQNEQHHIACGSGELYAQAVQMDSIRSLMDYFNVACLLSRNVPLAAGAAAFQPRGTWCGRFWACAQSQKFSGTSVTASKSMLGSPCLTRSGGRGVEKRGLMMSCTAAATANVIALKMCASPTAAPRDGLAWYVSGLGIFVQAADHELLL